MPKPVPSIRPERPLHSKTWLAKYGQGLQRAEIRLVQAYRGLSPTDQAALLRFASDLVITGAGRGDR